MKRIRVIEQLRREFGGTWRYDQFENAWLSEDGKRVEPRSHMAPRTPSGDDDNFVTRYWRIDLNPMEQVTII